MTRPDLLLPAEEFLQRILLGTSEKNESCAFLEAITGFERLFPIADYVPGTQYFPFSAPSEIRRRGFRVLLAE